MPLLGVFLLIVFSLCSRSVFFSPISLPFCSRPSCLRSFVLSSPGCPWPWRSSVSPAPLHFPFLCLLPSCALCPCSLLLWRSLVPASGASGLGVVRPPRFFFFFFLGCPPPPVCVCCALCCLLLPSFVLWLPALYCCGLLRVMRCLFGPLSVGFAVLCRAVGCCCVLRLWSLCPNALFALWLDALPCCGVLCCVPGCCVAPRCFLSCSAVVFWVVKSGAAGCRWLLCRALGLGRAPWGVVPPRAVFSRACLPFVLCAVCFAVVCWCVLLPAAVLFAVCVLGSHAVPRLSSSGYAALCCAVVVWCACVVLGDWSVLFLAPRALVRSSVLCFSLLVFCGVELRCAAGCGVCCAAARCAVFFCVLSCCAEAPLLHCCVRAVMARLYHAPVLCAVASVVLGGVLWCCLWFLFDCRWASWPVVAAWSRVAAFLSLAGPVGVLLFVVVCHGALLPCALSCGALPPCGALLLCPPFFFCVLSMFFCSGLLQRPLQNSVFSFFCFFLLFVPV